MRRLAWLGLAVAACAGQPGGGAPPAQPPAPIASTRQVPRQPDVVSLYRQMGLLAEAGETPFVGALSFFAGPVDSTSIVLAVSLANRVLRFRAEGDRYRASYDVAFEVRSGSDVVADIRSREVVRVLAFRETTRDDESVLFRQVVTLAPGTYDIRLTVRDESAPRGSAVEATIGVPQFAEGTVSSPTLIYEARPREELGVPPDILPTPRSTAVFGRDSVVMVYAEGYGTGSSFPLNVVVRSEDESNAVLWRDTVQLSRHGDHFSSTFPVPIARLGVGVMSLGINAPGSTDTLNVPLFVAFGEDLPVATFSQMLDYLRYFVSPQRLQAMRDADPEQRAALWAAFLKDTDPVPQTPAHEGLRDYFGRIAQANLRFREEGQAGWLTDRGRVLVALGQPDQTYEPTLSDIGQRGRTLIWEYRDHRLQVVFRDQTGFGRWRMTLTSESEFEAVVRRVIQQ